MKIFKIKVDLKKSRWILKDTKENLIEILSFDCKKKPMDQLMNEPWYVDNPVLENTDFQHLTSGTFVFKEKLLESEIGVCLEAAGQLLPFEVEDQDQKYYALNVLQCMNVFDRDNSEYETSISGDVTKISKYQFKTHRLGESSIFKIPEKRKTEIYTISGRDEDIEFYSLYNKLGLSGLKFNLIYED